MAAAHGFRDLGFEQRPAMEPRSHQVHYAFFEEVGRQVRRRLLRRVARQRWDDLRMGRVAAGGGGWVVVGDGMPASCSTTRQSTHRLHIEPLCRVRPSPHCAPAAVRCSVLLPLAAKLRCHRPPSHYRHLHDGPCPCRSCDWRAGRVTEDRGAACRATICCVVRRAFRCGTPIAQLDEGVAGGPGRERRRRPRATAPPACGPCPLVLECQSRDLNHCLLEDQAETAATVKYAQHPENCSMLRKK